MLHRALALTLTAMTFAAAACVAFPSGASATVNPTLQVNEGTGAVGGSTGSLGFTLGLTPTSGDAAKNVTLVFPDGVLINEEISGGGCLGVTTVLPQCEIGSGTATIGGVPNTPLALYLVQAPASTDLAGVELVAGSLTVPGDLVFHSTSSLTGVSLDAGEEIEWNSLPSSASSIIDSLNFTLTGVTLPSVCTQTTADLYVTSDSVATQAHASAPFVTVLCNELSFSPAIPTATITRNPGSVDGSFSIVMTDPAGNSPIEDIKVQVPPNLSPNPALIPCINGVVCTIGTITATSPIFPSSLLSGTINLAGTARDLLLTMDFPAPLSLDLTGELVSSLQGPELKLSELPDMPLSSLTINLVGNGFGGAFAIECYPTNIDASLEPWNGTTGAQAQQTVTLDDCPGAPASPYRVGRPKATAALSGASGDAPRLSVKAAAGKGAAPIRSLSISLPSGLGFSSALIHGGHISKHVLTITGAKLASAKLHRNTLVLVFAKAVSRSSVSVSSPLLTESAALHGDALKPATHGRAGHLTVRITDATGRVTTLTPSLSVG